MDHSCTVVAKISLVNRLHSKLLRRLSNNINVTGIFLIYPSIDTVLHGNPFPKFYYKLRNEIEQKPLKRQSSIYSINITQLSSSLQLKGMNGMNSNKIRIINIIYIIFNLINKNVKSVYLSCCLFLQT